MAFFKNSAGHIALKSEKKNLVKLKKGYSNMGQLTSKVQNQCF